MKPYKTYRKKSNLLTRVNHRGHDQKKNDRVTHYSYVAAVFLLYNGQILPSLPFELKSLS